MEFQANNQSLKGDITMSVNSSSSNYVKAEEQAKGRADKEKKELLEKMKKELKENFVRVGDDYYKMIKRPDRAGKFHIEYLRRSKETIKDDFGGKAALKYIDKYEDWIYLPDNINYTKNYHGFFNKYEPVSHIPKEGDYSTILSLLKHLFGNHLEFILDYLKLFYTEPTRRLPIILLESKEKGTGKSTFGILLDKIFQGNATKIGNNDLKSDFNAFWVQKIAIIIDEAQLNKGDIGEMLKRFSTETGEVIENAKGKNQRKVSFYGKFVFISNQEGNAVNIERGETRYAVFKAQTFESTGIDVDPSAHLKMEEEIPAFLYFLLNRPLYHKEQSRMYFAPSVYTTSQLLAYFEGSLSYVAKAVKLYIKDAFDVFPEENEVKVNVGDLLNELKIGQYVRNLERLSLKEVLEKELGLQQQSRGRYQFFHVSVLESQVSEDLKKFNVTQENKVYYVFTRSQFGS